MATPDAPEVTGRESSGSSQALDFLPVTSGEPEPMDVPGNTIPQDQVDSVRKMLRPEFATTCDDVTVRRFITATGGNLQLSAKRLNNTLAWRSDVKPESVVCKACAKDPRAHYMHLVGHCKIGRPIIYSCLAMADNRNFEDNKAHMIQTFETAVKCMPPGVSQWIWVCDFHGFKAADCNPRLAKLFLDLSAEHYPERLGLFMVVGAPKLFKVLWEAISSFVDPKTYRKIRFLPHDTNPEKHPVCTLKKELDVHFDDVTVQWLLREMDQNRDKATIKKKVYSYPVVYRNAKDGDFEPFAVALKEGWPLPSSKVHDVRGCPSLLAAYHERPHLLEPQALATK